LNGRRTWSNRGLNIDKGQKSISCPQKIFLPVSARM
jgi:hypothetical protein